VTGGEIQGHFLPSPGGAVFLGIPFAHPPGSTNVPFSPAFNAKVEAALIDGVSQSISPFANTFVVSVFALVLPTIDSCQFTP
jgi:hypothetical protein